MIVCVASDRVLLYGNLGGTAEVDFSRLLSLVGTKVFFVYV